MRLLETPFEKVAVSVAVDFVVLFMRMIVHESETLTTSGGRIFPIDLQAHVEPVEPDRHRVNTERHCDLVGPPEAETLMRPSMPRSRRDAELPCDVDAARRRVCAPFDVRRSASSTSELGERLTRQASSRHRSARRLRPAIIVEARFHVAFESCLGLIGSGSYVSTLHGIARAELMST